MTRLLLIPAPSADLTAATRWGEPRGEISARLDREASRLVTEMVAVIATETVPAVASRDGRLTSGEERLQRLYGLRGGHQIA